MGPHCWIWWEFIWKKNVQAFSRRLCVAGSASAWRLITPGHVQTRTCSSGSHKGTGQRVRRNLSVHMGGKGFKKGLQCRGYNTTVLQSAEWDTQIYDDCTFSVFTLNMYTTMIGNWQRAESKICSRKNTGVIMARYQPFQAKNQNRFKSSVIGISRWKLTKTNCAS